MIIIDLRLCQETVSQYFLCEVQDSNTQGTEPPLPTSPHIPQLLSANQTTTDVSGIQCPDGHMTHTFLACDYLSRCFAQGFDSKTDMWGIPDVTSCPAPLTPLPPLMTCTSAGQRVPYSLVCDHRQDCQDGSDEEFCVFEPCPAHLPNRCGKTQCYSMTQLCDDRVDCVSGLDEADCPRDYLERTSPAVPDPPVIVNYDGRGNMEILPLNLLQTLNLSGGGIEHVVGEGQQLPRKLHVLDVRGCPFLTFQRNMLSGTVKSLLPLHIVTSSVSLSPHIASVLPLLRAEQRCQPTGPGGARQYNGKMCASTTRYDDGHRGSCGCGPTASDTPWGWNQEWMVTAPSEKYFNNGGMGGWCGANCGKCVKLTPTGGFVPNEGGPTRDMSPQIFMVTNSCPIGDNMKWCGIWGAPGTGNKNTFGYEVHFDLQDNHGQMERLGWNNPEVTWEEVGCNGPFEGVKHMCECPMN
ncbi:hypothetical protein BaRGS_00032512 [Batillaria attramentaria]|uniref:Cellulase n=1 Tax=Batillaria attramentaria TaxID=370345 RepID=A0ABD0JNE6_9CAEN